MDAKLLELLVCPVTKGPLRFDREHQELVSRSARLAYPVRDGIPVLLEAEARTLDDDELEDWIAPQGPISDDARARTFDLLRNAPCPPRPSRF